MTNPFIQEIFLKADKILREANRLFICGYSFPDADMHIKYLLISVQRAEKFRGRTSEIYIINNHPNKTRQQKSEKKEKSIIRIHHSKNLLKEVHQRSSIDYCSKMGLIVTKNSFLNLKKLK